MSVKLAATSIEEAALANAPVPARALTGYRALVRDLGGEPAILLERAGIDPAALDTPDSSLGFAAVAALLEDSAQALNCADFGMRLAERQDGLRLFTPLYRLIAHAPTLQDALDWTVSHGQAYTTAVRASTIYDPDRRVYAQRYRFPADGPPIFSQFVEMILLLTQNAIVALSGGFVRAHEICFSHRRLSSQANYRAKFRATVKFGQDFDAALFTEEAIHARLLDADRDVFQSEAQVVTARYPPAAEQFDSQAREAVGALLLEGRCTRENVAHRLKTSVRTLHRKLATSGQSFELLRDEVRRSLALRYLRCTDLLLTDIAAKLGYAELSVLSRSCQRWFASSPSALRRDSQLSLPR